MNRAAAVTTIYVVGASRSGTTLMARILGQHSAIHTFEELHFFERLWTPAREDGAVLEEAEAVQLAATLLTVEREAHPWGRPVTGFQEEARAVLSRIPAGARRPVAVYRAVLAAETARAGKRIACEQTPRNVFFADEILALDPGARIVGLVRDPRAVLLSQKHRWKRRQLGADRIPAFEAFRNRVNYHPITITRLWTAAADALDRLKGEPRVRTIRFEDLTGDPERQVRSLCEWLGLPYEPAMLAVPQVGSSRESDQPDALGIRDSARAGWTRGDLSRAEVRLCERTAGARLIGHGYAASDARPAMLALLWEWVVFPFHLAGVVLVNLHRVRNPIAAIRRRLRSSGRG